MRNVPETEDQEKLNYLVTSINEWRRDLNSRQNEAKVLPYWDTSLKHEYTVL